MAGGYQGIDFDQTARVAGLTPMSRMITTRTLLITHQREFRHITAVDRAGHETQLGVNSNHITLNYVRHFATWNIIRNTCFRPSSFMKMRMSRVELSPNTCSVGARA